jgi:hypothetical protein
MHAEKLQNPSKKSKKVFVQNNIADDSDDDLLIEFGSDAPSQ